jgi:hypothetical protein
VTVCFEQILALFVAGDGRAQVGQIQQDAPDSISAMGLSSGPCGSSSAGILLLGLILKKITL